MKLQLTRNLMTDTVTLGYIGDRDTDFVLYTLENPWKDNKPYISCIPAGDYTCKRVASPKFGDTFEVQGVTGRTHILFHQGNYERNTHGCILLGKDVGPTKEMIMRSRLAMQEFRDYTKDVNEFALEIIE